MFDYVLKNIFFARNSLNICLLENKIIVWFRGKGARTFLSP